MTTKPALIIALPHGPAINPSEALVELRAVTTRTPALRLRLKRLGRLLAGGRAMTVIGDPARVRAFQHAILAYATQTTHGREPFLLEDLPQLPADGLHLTWCDARGWPICAYDVQPAPATPNLLRVTAQDGQTRTVTVGAFKALFQNSTCPLYGPRGWRPAPATQAAA